MPPKRTSTRRAKSTTAHKSKDEESKPTGEAAAQETNASQDTAGKPSDDTVAGAATDAAMEADIEVSTRAPSAADEVAVPAEDASTEQVTAAETVAVDAPAAKEEQEPTPANDASTLSTAAPIVDAEMDLEEPVVQLEAASPDPTRSAPVDETGRLQSRSAKGSPASRPLRNVDEDSTSAKKEPSSGPSRTTKGRRRLAPDPHMARRGGLLGVLNSTLGKVLDDNKKMENGDAAKRRAELEARAREKVVRIDQDNAEALREERQRRADELAARRLTEQIVSGDAEHRATRASKRRLASFLVTPSEMALEAGRLHRIIAPRVPAAIAPLPAKAPSSARAPDAHSLYFLPKKLTNAQEDLLDDQEDEVDDDIAKADEVWAEAREKLMTQLEVVKKKLEDNKSKKEDKVDDDTEMKSAETEPKEEDVEMDGVKDEEMDDAAKKRQDALEAPPLPNTVTT